MKTLKICIWTGISLLVLLTSACLLGNVTITILQTSDLHHHASGYGPFLDYTPLNTADNDEVLGGYSRLAALINNIRKDQAAKHIPVLLFDSGDFFMGTVYDMTATDPKGPAALKFFTQMKYDAITLGNHEFEWTPSGLAKLLNYGVTAGFNVPIVASNMAITNNDDPLQYFVSKGVITNKKVIEFPYGLKVGVLGLMGPNADTDAPAAKPDVTFSHDYSSSGIIQGMVNDLRNNDHVRLVIALSHSGIRLDGTGDDADLANKVSGIDIICSGHYHTATPSVFSIGPSNTIIYEPGAYGEYLSRIDVTYNVFLKKIVNYKYTLIPVDDKIQGDTKVQTTLDQYNAGVSAQLHGAGLPGLADPVSSTTFTLEEAPFQVTGIGGLAADSLRAVANYLAPLNGGTPFDIGVVPCGVIRDGIYPGKTGAITFSDAYNMLPLGISPNDQSVPGYPLMSVYATGLEVYTICEVGLSLSQLLGSDYYLNFSGLKIDYDPSKAPSFHGVQAVYEYAPNDTFCTGVPTPTLIDPYDPDKLYHVVVDYYALQMLYVVNSYGFSINPKNVSFIDRDPADGLQDLKEWMALLKFLPMLGGSIPSNIYGPQGIVLDRVY